MNLMSDDECAQNIADITRKPPEYYKNYITERGLICAGSVPTKFGITSCFVRWNYELHNSEFDIISNVYVIYRATVEAL